MSKDVPPEKGFAPEGERGGFLQRWSKRKLEEKTTAPVPDVPGPDVLAPPVEEEPFDISTLPTLEEITGDSDLSVFLQKGVPQALKNAAMRRVWALDPQISAISGPLDYAWDFNDPNGVPGFGPLAADFDPSAMLKRIMGESDPEPDAEDEKNTVAQDERMEEQAMADSASRDAKVAEESPLLLADMQNSAVFSPVSDADEAEKMSILQMDNLKIQAQEEETDQKSQILLLRKRHGGAVPI